MSDHTKLGSSSLDAMDNLFIVGSKKQHTKKKQESSGQLTTKEGDLFIVTPRQIALYHC
jgi:hypothetical protein